MGTTAGHEGDDRRRILIVEDDMATLYAMRELFASRGWDVATSKTVAGALSLLDPPPAWIILDLGLADGDGQEVLRHIRMTALPCRVAVVSAALDSERMESLRPLEPDAVIPKPVRFERLAAVCEVETPPPLPPKTPTSEPTGLPGSIPALKPKESLGFPG
jgi:DNA-binding response OmpR family regulator